MTRSVLLALLCLPVIFTGCTREADPKTYGIPVATAEDIRTVVCPTKTLQPAKAVACPDLGH